MSPDFWDKLPSAVVWFVGAAVVGIIMIQRLAEAKKNFAELFGPLGRYWYQRAEQRKTFEQQRDQDHIDRAVKSALDKLTPVAFKDLERKISRQDHEIKRLDTELSEMRTVEVINTAYIIEDARWHVQVEIELAEHKGLMGYMLPKRLSYIEFAKKYRDDRGWTPA